MKDVGFVLLELAVVTNTVGEGDLGTCEYTVSAAAEGKLDLTNDCTRVGGNGGNVALTSWEAW